MTRLSSFFLPTEREPPADAEAISHKLMVRAGLVRQVGSGLWTWLPAGWRVHQRIVQIVREEMNAIGGQEMLMPVLHPAEPWKRSGRYPIEELFKLKDRRGADMVLALTHEEIVTGHVAAAVRSYRDLPLILYHFQVKERDEARPRAGVLRTREFIMKDSYTFDRDGKGLDAAYRKHIEAYDRMLDRCGLEWYRVEADVGVMGGLGAHEYMAPCAAGENDVALAPGYAANVEVARARAQPVPLPPALEQPEEVHTPGMTTVEAVAQDLGVPAGAVLKAFPVFPDDDTEMKLVVVRGDHRVNDIKLRVALRSDFRPATGGEVEKWLGPPGFIGPVGARMPILLDEAVAGGGYVAGANKPDAHLRGVQPGRDFRFEPVDVRSVVAGDSVNGAAIRIERAIEVGNIFKLGTRYSEPLGARYLDESGAEQLIWMGSYGFGPARAAAAAVEQYADEQGISWPRAMAPFDLELVVIGKPDSEERALAERLYGELQERGLATLYDDRDAGPGEKFADAELLGCPARITVGRRVLASGELEVQIRRGRETRTVPLDGAADAIAELWRGLP
ncbi:MAG: proline--tRNA ligase [Solirubrobacterales bacterium]|nr:proline--tRNA ligase [Solirubrobacterales bacterium]MBV9800427.1 proline--tRNA ligase [Solirubrobacterales bacterium]